MAGETEKTSLKQLFQGMIKDDVEVLQGIVKSVNPLKIQIEGDEKLTIGENITYIPRHLTDYKTELSFDDPAIRNNIHVDTASQNPTLPLSNILIRQWKRQRR